ncbi:LuxR family transcriptional regulator [Solirubrobacter taibaiensis]|nr:LuxR family transcriptional regulator [Solirubrobacter taibaiensis]
MIGRDQELLVVRFFLQQRFEPTALVLRGEPGIGKTTLWEAAVALAREDDLRVLVARPSESESEHAFAGLIDLCEGLDLSGLPAPQRAALEVALLRRDGASPEPHAVGLALRGALATAAPVLVAIDDVQWLDTPSAEALAYAARRLVDAPVGLLLTGCEVSPLEQWLVEHSLTTLELGALAAGDLRAVIADRLGVELPVAALQRITAATLGNPRFALRLARSTGPTGAEEELLGVGVAELPDAERHLLLAAALDGGLRLEEAEALSLDVREAMRSGLLEVDGDRVRPGHPLLAAAVLADALPSERREVHAALADVVDDPERYALHLASATEGDDEEVAEHASGAAAHAAARGARPEAVALGEQALRLTSRGVFAAAWEQRVLDLAGYLVAAGERRRVRELLVPVIDRLPPGEPQVRVWLYLAESDVATSGNFERQIERALEAAGSDAALHRRVVAFKALCTAAEGVQRVREAEAWALEALPELNALRALGWTRVLRGADIEQVCAQFDAAAGPGARLIDSPQPLVALRRSWRGEIAPAREEVVRLMGLAAERGESAAFAWLRLNLCEIELRAGEWDAAERLLDEWEVSDDGEFLSAPAYQRCRALLAVGRGDHETAEAWARPAVERASQREHTWNVLSASRALGAAALLAGDPAAAAEHLRFVHAHCEREGVDEPGVFPVAADLLEALGEIGADDEAEDVRARLAAQSFDHPWAQATLARADGEAEAAATAYEQLGLRFDAARTRLAHGRALRRARQWRAARDALEAAAQAFDALGSPGWAEQARAELARVGGRKPRTDANELTHTERQVAELAAAGRTNKEIAHTLFVTTHTVEAHLSKAYAKLGVRSRTELAAQL